MTDFATAFQITMQNEGGYNPGDGEAETYAGIDRSQNGDWRGWATIDAIKQANPGASVADLDAIFAADQTLQTNISNFYQQNYWSPLQLNTINDQQVANALFDCSVNPCILSVSRVAQMVCNILKPGTLTVDGSIGPLSLNAINSFPPDQYVSAFNGFRAADYYARVRSSPADAQWLDSWLSRCRPYV
jgi:lysozyme family protein